MRNLSEEAKYFRFMRSMQELTLDMLIRFTQIDYDTEMALIAVINDEKPNARAVGVARYVSKGIAHRLMHLLMDVARDRGLEVMEGEILSNNNKMLDLVRSLGFRVTSSIDDASIKHASLTL